MSARSATVHLPFVTARFELHGSPIPHVVQRAQPRPGPWRIGPVAVPSPGKTAYYMGLGALAVVELVEWPIAAAIAAGTYVAQHTRGDRSAVAQQVGGSTSRRAAS